MKIAIENFWWKLASLIVAIALWFILILEPDLVTSASVPIFFGNIPKGYEFSSEAPGQVVLEIRGPASKLSRPLTEDDPVPSKRFAPAGMIPTAAERGVQRQWDEPPTSTPGVVGAQER